MINTILSSFPLIIIVLLLVCYYYCERSRTRKYIMKLRGPRSYPIIGNLLLLLIPAEKLWTLLRGLAKNYYPIYRLTSLHLSAANIVNAYDAEVLLSSMNHIEKSLYYDLLHCWIGTGLITSSGSKWHHRRKILTPAFHFNVLKKYLDIITENSERLIESLKHEGESVQSLMPLMAKYTLDVICEAAMGIETKKNAESQKKYMTALHKMREILFYRFSRPYLTDWIFNRTEKGRQQTQVLQDLHDFTTQIINNRKDYHEQTNGEFLKSFDLNDSKGHVLDDEVFSGIRKRRLAMLDLLIAAQKAGQIDDLGIREEVDTFTFAGHDTTTAALCFLLLLLAEHKDVQTRAREEVNEVLSNINGKIRAEDLQKLHYLERCIKESLRLYPSVTFISRNVTQDLHLTNYVIPKGALAHIHIFDVHRDPNVWPEPDKYDPDRFLPENSQNRHPFAFIPFSGGPRNCIGQKFAMMELKSVTAHLLHNFYLEPIDLAHEVPIQCNLVIRSSRPLHIKLIPISL